MRIFAILAISSVILNSSVATRPLPDCLDELAPAGKTYRKQVAVLEKIRKFNAAASKLHLPVMDLEMYGEDSMIEKVETSSDREAYKIISEHVKGVTEYISDFAGTEMPNFGHHANLVSQLQRITAEQQAVVMSSRW